YWAEQGVPAERLRFVSVHKPNRTLAYPRHRPSPPTHTSRPRNPTMNTARPRLHLRAPNDDQARSDQFTILKVARLRRIITTGLARTERRSAGCPLTPGRGPSF